MVQLMIIIFVLSMNIFQSYQDKFNVDLGQDVTFSCVFTDESDLNLVSFMYQSTGAILSVGLDLFLDRSFGNNQLELIRFSSTRLDLKIFSVNQNDSGLYSCMIEHQILASFLLEIYVPPRLLSYSPSEASITYTEQLPLNLSCHVFAIPPANITWIYTNHNKQSRIIHRGDDIYISSVKSVDSGLYECTASNGYHATISRSFYVTVQYSPRIIKTQMNISTKLHRELTCEICSIPKSSIFWFQNGNQLVSNQNYFIKFHSKLIDNEQCTTTTLIIHNSPNGKDGRYECRAENLLGHKSEHFDTHSKIAVKSRSDDEYRIQLISDSSIDLVSISKLNLFMSFILLKFVF